MMLRKEQKIINIELDGVCHVYVCAMYMLWLDIAGSYTCPIILIS